VTLTPEQLDRFFHLDEQDKTFVRGDLGRALQLGTFSETNVWRTNR
jgi:hypothetical protein